MNPDPTKRLSIEAIKRHRWYRRSNSLLKAAHGGTQCTDPSTLAERLLQGLIVNGEMDYAAPLTAEERAKQLHSDGARAAVPEMVSFTQPEAVQDRTLHLGGTATRDSRANDMLPPSTALPRLSGPAAARRGDFLETLSQQLSNRREEFMQSQQHQYSGRRDDFALIGSSQFTETLNLLTQRPSSLAANPTALSLTPNLTRFLSQSSPSIVASRLSAVFYSIRAQHVVEPLGDAFVGGEDGDKDAVPVEASNNPADDMELEPKTIDVYHQESRTTSRHLSSSDNATIVDAARGSPETSRAASNSDVSGMKPGAVPEGSKGTRIRLALFDTRKCQLKGEVRIERLGEPSDGSGTGHSQTAGVPTCLITMRRSRGDPLEWRKVFGKVVKDPQVSKCICR